MSLADSANLVDALSAVAAKRSGQGVHIRRRGRETGALSYADLYKDAGRLAAGLRARGVRPGDRVALVLPTSLDFARAFFGVLAAGAVAVPLPEPLPLGASHAYTDRTAGALTRSTVRTVLAAPSTVAVLTRMLSGVAPGTDVLTVSDVLADEPLYEPRTGTEAALIQYTSGTGSDPRGVVLSHANLAAGVAAIAEGTALTADDVGCTWLPLFHDMGLIGSFLTPVLHDADIHLQRPEDFLWDPLGWVRTVGEVGATFTMAPDSGYRYVLRRGRRASDEGLDLSRWRIAVNGAEPVDRALQDEFVARFASAGLRAGVFMPAYGLAEATLAVTLSPQGRLTRTLRARRDALGRGVLELAAETEPHRELVSVGTPVARTEIRLTDTEGRVLPAGGVGRIEVRGASVTTTGYDSHPAETLRTLLPGGWITTGDLGVCHEESCTWWAG